MKNKLKQVFAKVVILLYSFTWRVLVKLKFPINPEWIYYVGQFFRTFKRFEVTITFRNFLNKRFLIKMPLDLHHNADIRCFVRYKIGSLSDKKDKQRWIKVLNTALKDNAFIDVGAHRGEYTLMLAQNSLGNHFFAIEPGQRAFLMLRHNIYLNRTRDVYLMNKAVSTKENDINFFINPLSDGASSTAFLDCYSTGQKKIPIWAYKKQHPDFKAVVRVGTIKLDELIIGRTVIKIDVEGAELDVLKSGEQSFKKGLIRTLVIEVREKTFKDVFSYLKQYGFMMYVYRDRATRDVSEHFGEVGIGFRYCKRLFDILATIDTDYIDPVPGGGVDIRGVTNKEKLFRKWKES